MFIWELWDYGFKTDLKNCRSVSATRKSVRVNPLFLFPALWDEPTASFLPSDAETSSVGRRKSVFLYLEIKPNRVFLLRRLIQGAQKSSECCLLKWRFLRLRLIYRWTEPPWAATLFPLKTTLTSTRKSWIISQRNTEKTILQLCLCTHLGHFGWTGNIVPFFRIVVEFRAQEEQQWCGEIYWRPQLSAGLREQM